MNQKKFFEQILLSQKKARWQSLVFLFGLCLLGLSLVSYLRFWICGTLNLDAVPFQWKPEILVRVLLFIFMATIVWIFLKLLYTKIEEKDFKKLLVYTFLLYGIAALALPLTSNDLFSNLAYGEMLQKGLNPQNGGPSLLDPEDPFRKLVSPKWIHTPMVYGPLMGWLNQGAVYSGRVWQSVMTFKFIFLIFSWMIVGLVYGYCKTRIPEKQRISSFILCALNPLLIWELGAQAHNDGIMVLATLAFVCLASWNRVGEALICLGIAILFKMSVLPALGLYLCYLFFNYKKYRLLFVMLGVAGGVIFFLHFYGKLELALALPFSAKEDPSRIINSLSFLIYKIFSPGGEKAQIWAYRIFFTMTWGFMVFLGLRFIFRTRTLDLVFRNSFLFLLFFILIALPNYQPWYVTWLLPFVVTFQDESLQDFIVIYSVLSILQYPISISIVLSLLNIGLLRLFWAQTRLGKRTLPTFLLSSR